MQAFLSDLSAGEMRKISLALHPDRWAAFAQNHQLNWQLVPFRVGGAPQVPNVSGFYCFVVMNPAVQLPLVLYPLYAGETDNLRRRYRDYLREKDKDSGRVHVRKFLSVFWNEIVFAYAPLNAVADDRRVIEKQLNDALMPPYSIKDFSAQVKAARGAWQ